MEELEAMVAVVAVAAITTLCMEQFMESTNSPQEILPALEQITQAEVAAARDTMLITHMAQVAVAAPAW
jgi:hypothetical protein